MTDPRDELARLAAEVADLPNDAFREKYEIHVQMDAIRADLPVLHKDDGRSVEDMRVELREHRAQLKELMRTSAIAITPMSDGAGGSGDAAHVVMRQKLIRTGDWIKVRIGELESAIDKSTGA
jgi:hypothetical protein